MGTSKQGKFYNFFFSKGYMAFLFFQIYACMMTFFLSNMIEGQLIATGAFEISLNGKCL